QSFIAFVVAMSWNVFALGMPVALMRTVGEALGAGREAEAQVLGPRRRAGRRGAGARPLGVAERRRPGGGRGSGAPRRRDRGGEAAGGLVPRRGDGGSR